MPFIEPTHFTMTQIRRHLAVSSVAVSSPYVAHATRDDLNKGRRHWACVCSEIQTHADLPTLLYRVTTSAPLAHLRKVLEKHVCEVIELERALRQANLIE